MPNLISAFLDWLKDENSNVSGEGFILILAILLLYAAITISAKLMTQKRSRRTGVSNDLVNKVYAPIQTLLWPSLPTTVLTARIIQADIDKIVRDNMAIIPRFFRKDIEVLYEASDKGDTHVDTTYKRFNKRLTYYIDDARKRSGFCFDPMLPRRFLELLVAVFGYFALLGFVVTVIMLAISFSPVHIIVSIAALSLLSTALFVIGIFILAAIHYISDYCYAHFKFLSDYTKSLREDTSSKTLAKKQVVGQPDSKLRRVQSYRRKKIPRKRPTRKKPH